MSAALSRRWTRFDGGRGECEKLEDDLKGETAMEGREMGKDGLCESCDLVCFAMKERCRSQGSWPFPPASCLSSRSSNKRVSSGVVVAHMDDTTSYTGTAPSFNLSSLPPAAQSVKSSEGRRNSTGALLSSVLCGLPCSHSNKASPPHACVRSMFDLDLASPADPLLAGIPTW